MSFWNDLKKSGQEAAGKAKDLAEVTRLQLAQKEQERKLEKLYGQLGKACYDAAVPGEDSPFSELISAIAQTLDEIEQSIQNSLEREVSTTRIGELVMERLKPLDEVAYVRFASVYRQFKDINTFMQELSKILAEK